MLRTIWRCIDDTASAAGLGRGPVLAFSVLVAIVLLRVLIALLPLILALLALEFGLRALFWFQPQLKGASASWAARGPVAIGSMHTQPFLLPETPPVADCEGRLNQIEHWRVPASDYTEQILESAAVSNGYPEVTLGRLRLWAIPQVLALLFDRLTS